MHSQKVSQVSRWKKPGFIKKSGGEGQIEDFKVIELESWGYGCHTCKMNQSCADKNNKKLPTVYMDIMCLIPKKQYIVPSFSAALPTFWVKTMNMCLLNLTFFLPKEDRELTKRLQIVSCMWAWTFNWPAGLLRNSRAHSSLYKQLCAGSAGYVIRHKEGRRERG